MRRSVFAAFALVAFAACQPATTELTEEQKTEIAAEVNALHAQMWEPWLAADVDRGMSYYPDIPELTYAYDGKIFRGAAAIEEDARSTFSRIASQDISFTETYTDVLAPNLVIINQRGTVAVTDTAGVVEPQRVFAGTYVWVKVDGAWKLPSSHESGFTIQGQ